MKVFQNLFKDNNSLKNITIKKYIRRYRLNKSNNYDPCQFYILHPILRHRVMKIFTGARLYESLNDISDICEITQFKYISEYTDDPYFWRDRLL